MMKLLMRYEAVVTMCGSWKPTGFTEYRRCQIYKQEDNLAVFPANMYQYVPQAYSAELLVRNWMFTLVNEFAP